MENDDSLRIYAKYGGFVLAFSAGSANISSLIGILGIPVSHLTGTISRMSMHLYIGNFRFGILLLIVVLSFICGAIFSGFFIGDSDLKFGRRYGIVLIFQGIIIYLSIPLLRYKTAYGEYLLAFALGMQNSLATTFSGAILRSTHLTGIITDIGIIIGKSIRSKKLVSGWHLNIYIAILLGFMSGSVAGYFLFSKFHVFSLILPASLSLLIGVVYYIWRTRKKQA